MGGEYADYRAKKLGGDISDGLRYGQFPAQNKHPRHGRIEVRARDRTEHGDEHEEDGAGRQGIAKQSDRDFPPARR